MPLYSRRKIKLTSLWEGWGGWQRALLTLTKLEEHMGQVIYVDMYVCVYAHAHVGRYTHMCTHLGDAICHTWPPLNYSGNIKFY